MTKILILGATGQMGRACQRFFGHTGPYDVSAFGRSVDICSRDSLTHCFSNTHPDIVINCAAITAVDVCESQSDLAFAVNEDGARNVAQACLAFGSALIHLSTDYVFGRKGQAPFRETDAPDPLNIYCASKLAGECAIQSLLPQHVILRTSWIFGPDAGNFFATMMKLANKLDTIKVVADEVSCPTSSDDLAAAIGQICASLGTQSAAFGIYHTAGHQDCSRYKFAQDIMTVRRNLGLPAASMNQLHRVSTRPQPLGQWTRA